MRTRWAVVALATAAATVGASLWLQREAAPPDLTGSWRLRPDPPRPAGAMAVPRPLGSPIEIGGGEMRWQGAGGQVARPYALRRAGDLLVLTIDLDGDGGREELPLSWLADGGTESFGLSQPTWSGWWTRQAAP